MSEDEKGDEVHGFELKKVLEILIPGRCLSDTETWRLEPAFISRLEEWKQG